MSRRFAHSVRSSLLARLVLDRTPSTTRRIPTLQSYHRICISVPNANLGFSRFAHDEVFHVGLTPSGAWEVHVSSRPHALPADLAEEVIHQALPYMAACFELILPTTVVDESTRSVRDQSVTDGTPCGVES